MPSPRLAEHEFKRRYLERFFDPAFGKVAAELDRIADIAWQAYADSRKSPVTRKAGSDFADPDYDLSVDWLAGREAIRRAQSLHDGSRRARVLIVNSSPRSEHTCPSEMSKTWRLAEIARETIEEAGHIETEMLDLSRLSSEYGRHIYPCKSCFSTAAALCHWPCSCYPNHSLGQVQDWMNDIYPMWVAAHAVMIITPVHWYSPTSPLKLMMDRLVCADGGNPDPTSTHGKKAEEAKKLELAGWDYPRHLQGRLFSVVVHGDTEGAENLRRSLVDWCRSIKLTPAGPEAELDRYVGYWQPYATSHDELDRDTAFQEEVKNAARALAEAVLAKRKGKLAAAGGDLEDPRKK